jgi:hypothetical protein
VFLIKAGRSIRGGELFRHGELEPATPTHFQNPFGTQPFQLALAGPVLARPHIHENVLDETGAIGQSKWVRWGAITQHAVFIDWRERMPQEKCAAGVIWSDDTSYLERLYQM